MDISPGSGTVTDPSSVSDSDWGSLCSPFW